MHYTYPSDGRFNIVLISGKNGILYPDFEH